MEESRVKLINVLLLGLAFMLVFTAFQAMSNIQTTILNSAMDPHSAGYVDGFTGSGYISLAVIYVVFAFANWFAPSVVSVMGPRLTMFVAAIIYCLFIGQIMYPNNILLYTASGLVGVGAAAIWTAQGNFLTLNSSPSTISRNSGILWAMLQCSSVIGNIVAYFQFLGKYDIDTKTRTCITLILLGVSVVGSLTFLLLRPTPWSQGTDSTSTAGPIAALKTAAKLQMTPDMMLLSVCFFYTGLSLTFWSGVYGTCLGNTEDFGEVAKSLIALHGMFVGAGEVLGGLAFGVFSKALTRYGRDPVVMLGFIISVVAFFLSFLNLPADSPSFTTSSHAYIESNAYLGLFTSFLLGFGDSCYNTQIYSILGDLYVHDSAPAFAIFKFIQSTSAAMAFFYSRKLPLHFQLLVLLVFCAAGTACFCLVEWKSYRRAESERSIQIRDEVRNSSNVTLQCVNNSPEPHQNT